MFWPRNYAPGNAIRISSRMKETPRYGNQEFGSVFRRSNDYGPRTIDNHLPSWPDMRHPGNMSSNESAKEIMGRWNTDMMKRFRIFMDSFGKEREEDYGPWVREWLEKSAPGYDKDRHQIVKCKLELIKRLLKIKVRGPESMEDFCLLFLYHDHRLDIPLDIESVLMPDTQGINLRDHFTYKDPGRNTIQWFVVPSENNAGYPANMTFPHFTDRDPTIGMRPQALADHRPLYLPKYYRFDRNNTTGATAADTNNWNDVAGPTRPGLPTKAHRAQSVFRTTDNRTIRRRLKNRGYRKPEETCDRATLFSKYP